MKNKSDGKKIDNIRHSLAHLLAAAVLEKFPDTQLGIGPVIENGFYYDFKFSKEIKPEILAELEKRMRELIKQKLPFSGKKTTPEEARKMFANQPFKLELIDEFEKNGENLTIYSTGSVFTDLCRGGHAKNTLEIKPDAFKLTHLAGAYWRGNEKNPQLTRIYAVAFSDKKELAAYLKMQEEAKKRDHKKLGVDLDLFTFSDLVGAGLPLFTPKGTILRDTLDNFVWELRKARGYERVDIPHIT
ncbi:MAG TPA: threonine--tRNA ligase, partial [Candidatus Paceibacterota bacterium]